MLVNAIAIRVYERTVSEVCKLEWRKVKSSVQWP